jgi:hypothetical protein
MFIDPYALLYGLITMYPAPFVSSLTICDAW